MRYPTAAAESERAPVIVGSRRWLIALLLLAVAAAALSVAVQRNVFPFYSGDRDEPVYRYQAQMLEEGRLTVPASQEQFFRPWLSGPGDGHLVMAFQPLWPAVLMIADTATNSMLPALAFAAMLGAAGVYALGVELFRDRRLGIGAAALYALSPFVLVLAGTFLNYVFAVALGTWMAVAVVRAVRRDSPAAAAGAGALFGLLFLTRPFDALLYALPLIAFAVASRRDHVEWRKLIRGGIVGAAPLVALTLVYNGVVTGSLLEFPTSAQSRGTAAFGWGRRSLAPEFPPENFTILNAFRALARNIAALPSWLVGAYVGVPLAAWGFQTRPVRDGPRLVLLVAMTFVFPIGYLAWWAITLTVEGAYVGIGPHYYLPVLVPLSLLMAAGIRDLVRRARSGRRPQRILLALTALIAVAGTAAFVPSRLDNYRFVADVERHQAQPVLDSVAARPGPLLVINQREPHPYVMLTHAVLANRPTLDTRVVYAVDRGSAVVDLIRAHPDRPAFRTVRVLDVGAPLSSIHPVLVPQRVIAGPRITLTSTIENRGERRVVTAYARFGDRRVARVIDTASVRGKQYEVRWTIGPSGVSIEPGPFAARVTRYPQIKEERPPQVPRAGRAPRVDVVVGASFSSRSGTRDPDRVELRYYARSRAGAVQFLTAPEQWTRIGAPISAWLPITVAGALRATPTASTTR